MVKAPLIVIVGPTAVGKTALSLWLAGACNGEIVSADSRQIYRGLDIGTAKPAPAELALVPHHLIDVVTPDQVLSLAEYQALAYAAIEAIQARGRLPLLVGGTGQWVQAVVEGWQVPRVPPDPELRASLEAEAAGSTPAALHARLAAIDPGAAGKIDPRNVRRVIRALEVYYKTGRPISEFQTRQPPPYDILQIGLTMARPLLYDRVDRRVEVMMALGLLGEIQKLVEAGYGWDLPAMSGLGYRQIGQYLRGEVSLDEAVTLIKNETHRFVRQQYTWFRPDDPQIHWFEIGDNPNPVYQEIKSLTAAAGFCPEEALFGES